ADRLPGAAHAGQLPAANGGEFVILAGGAFVRLDKPGRYKSVALEPAQDGVDGPFGDDQPRDVAEALDDVVPVKPPPAQRRKDAEFENPFAELGRPVVEEVRLHDG